jgi:hypothetical protein
MSHLSYIEVADEFGGPGERPNVTALPDGFPSNSPVTQRNADSTSRRHLQGDLVPQMRLSRQLMSAFAVAVGEKADMGWCTAYVRL